MAREGVLRKAVQVRAGIDQARSAGNVVEAMVGEPVEGVVLTFPDGRTVALPSSLVDVMKASAQEMASGHAVTVLLADAVLTPAEAAELLGLSRPFVVRLLDTGEIPSERLPQSRHRRVRLADVVAFAERRDRRREGRRKIGEAIAEEGLQVPAEQFGPGRKLGFVSLGRSTSGCSATEDESMLAEGFGR